MKRSSGKILAIFKIELILSALLTAMAKVKSSLCRLMQNCRAKLFIDKDGRLLFRHTICNGLLKTVVDHLLRSSNLRRLRIRERTLPAKHLRLERTTMIKGKNVKRLAKSARLHGVSWKTRHSR